MDTIFALASARGKSGVAVIRLSGPQAHAVAGAMAGTLPPPRQTALRKLVTPAGELLDHGLVVVFGRGASFTGEDVVEFMLHGSLATVAAVESCLAQDHGLRLAEPGEFTRRALENGVMDLTQVEGLGDLLDAETESQRRQALRVLEGAIGKLVGGWRNHLLKAAALVEAGIDFVEEDVGNWDDQILVELQTVRDQLQSEIAGQGARERVQTGFEIALVGSVNAGKSTLLNALAGREAAITSEIAGTTRDVIELRMDIGGFAVTLLDTAGLRETDEVIESIGIERGQARARHADMRIILCDSPFDPPPVAVLPDDIVLFSKADLYPDQPGGVSGKTGQGLDMLLDRIKSELAQRVARDGVTVRRRHLQAMLSAQAALSEAIDKLSSQDYIPELLAADIRQAINALDSLIGKIDVEDLLGDIFSSFCIGK
ncbi:tRNA uridine-5-carboxymethylaminomethyl(34) synthesis GTPase MnmE [Roseinatronobacter alkalisoli]|uniref:tRNA modification GTPase MnmE n=1 Tax=Roseinatronobacter alkalisoli TaxID=3028235 RepID=A0ABT5TCH3_9RHOB|nr:tRNA uridine-5-carboxymethylaminomethyl(34) synthesis GTPase MnmE [Roseinatronobacter sp. HJB301]MDD7971867.1 tRNA uridine-5-carboxymethylaminomethyl(34) synthesis GTPase MnmE [Roseinatronobacter sp. HJB301]